MSLTLETLQGLAAEGQLIRQRAALPLQDAQQVCLPLFKAVDKLRQKAAAIVITPTKLDPEHVWSAFAAASFDLEALNALQFRTLCCSEKTALRPEFIGALTRNPEKLTRSVCLFGLVNNYFSEWRTMNNATALERLLLSVFQRYRGKNPVVEKWGNSRPLFTPQGVDFLTEQICARQRGVDEVLKEFYVGPHTRLGLSVRASAATAACEFFRKHETRHDSEWSLRYLRWVTESVLSDLTLPDAFCSAVSVLILSESAERLEAFQHVLRLYVQNNRRLGDPRLRESAGNWRFVAPEAARRFLSWLARDSIIFFFNTILPNNHENRRRKDFWLRYHGRIKDFQVAVSGADLVKVKASQKTSELSCYSHTSNSLTSAFLMRFEGYYEDYIVVEFSKTGNAAHIFGAKDFETRRITMRTPVFRIAQLKLDSQELRFERNRIIHTGAWEQKASYKLSSEFGINP
jgi:hypothetical protein